MKHYAAIDLGAESGRVILGSYDPQSQTVEQEEIHRFLNIPVVLNGTRRWNLLQIFHEIVTGLKKLGERGIEITSVSCDTWGVDYVLLRGDEPMLTLPFQYRDSRTDGIFPRAEKIMPLCEIYANTGIQLMEINTLFQLFAQNEKDPEILRQADKLLPIGDYINYLLSGVAKSEVSLASTTQIFDTRECQWSSALLKAFNIPESIMPEVVPSATRLGSFCYDLGASANKAFEKAHVVATCSHDTGAAVAAVPAEGKGWAFLSSGTWSLLGYELPSPHISEASYEAALTNEAGAAGTTRFLKNIAGLFISQECKREWDARGNVHSYPEIEELSAASPERGPLIWPNDPRFLKPGDMPDKVASFCKETGQDVPEGVGPISRCIFESLAMLYHYYIEQLEKVLGEPIDRLHIVGGGSKNALLNQIIADTSGRTVLAGPKEGTALGNILLQAMADGQLASLQDLRKVIAKSFPVETFKPQNSAPWKEHYQRFLKLAQ